MKSPNFIPYKRTTFRNQYTEPHCESYTLSCRQTLPSVRGLATNNCQIIRSFAKYRSSNDRSFRHHRRLSQETARLGEVATLAQLLSCFHRLGSVNGSTFARMPESFDPETRLRGGNAVAPEIVSTDFASAFPRLPSYCQFMARLHALQPLVGRLIQQVLPDLTSEVYIVDSKPIALCKPIRHGRVRLLREDGAYFGKAAATQLRLNSCGWYFGFKLHAQAKLRFRRIAHQTGTILCAFLTPANIHDQVHTLVNRDTAIALAQAVDGGVLLADKAYQTQEMETFFDEQAELTLVNKSVL